MLRLEGLYAISPTKRMTLFADPIRPLSGVLASDLQAVQDACAANAGQCAVQVNTAFGWMQGTLSEKTPARLRLRSFEGHLSFLPRS
ncbi:hypothetical protein GO986_09575 [Deinococcus sp. HMF7620]|uniref:Uncharacterized protein n=1 Tax=Deinococcus arboris TaxID=2682977 RepID=A0A7C9HZG1_9DEIO|nr:MULTISPECIES: hypothetical protein [Deinococcus]MBZ9750823.1 hypothetical protein [Deinococcus betulae]MVN87015.1 hypothetical protein [Deinococcus arboris]